MAFPAGLTGPLINQPQHPLLDEVAGFFTNASSLSFCLMTSLGDRF